MKFTYLFHSSTSLIIALHTALLVYTVYLGQKCVQSLFRFAEVFAGRLRNIEGQGAKPRIPDAVLQNSRLLIYFFKENQANSLKCIHTIC